ncbi:MAG: hypothetical protein V4674_00935 [Patescibacteria group bacterium]
MRLADEKCAMRFVIEWLGTTHPDRWQIVGNFIPMLEMTAEEKKELVARVKMESIFKQDEAMHYAHGLLKMVEEIEPTKPT